MTADIRMRDVKEAVRPTVFFPLTKSSTGTLTLRLEPRVPEADLMRSLRPVDRA
jgi:hypothetical protein